MVTREAPPFHIWNCSDVHELVCTDHADLRERMRYGVRRCDIKDCDWCRDNRTLTVIAGGR
jgi:hypothetical protein